MLAYRKATGQHVTIAFLTERTQMAAQAGYSKAKWIEFCETMLSRGYNVFLTEDPFTTSKCILVKRYDKTFQVRYSADPSTEELDDCDFFVGKTIRAWTNWKQAQAATIEALES